MSDFLKHLLCYVLIASIFYFILWICVSFVSWDFGWLASNGAINRFAILISIALAVRLVRE